MRIPYAPREKAAILHLRKQYGYSINTLAKAFGRSTNIIHHILRFNHTIGQINLKDLRRLPGRIKKLATARMTRQLTFYMPQWTMWILGEEDKPP